MQSKRLGKYIQAPWQSDLKKVNPSAFLCPPLALRYLCKQLFKKPFIMNASRRAFRAVCAMLLLLCIMLVPHHHHDGGEFCWAVAHCHTEGALTHEHHAQGCQEEGHLRFCAVEFLRTAQPQWRTAPAPWQGTSAWWLGAAATIFFYFLHRFHGATRAWRAASAAPLPHPHGMRQVFRRGPPALLQ